MLHVTPGQKAADYSSPAIKVERLKELGYRFVVRYINGTTNAWKVLTPAERDRIYAAGLGLLLVWETSATRPLSGALGGRVDGQKAAADAYRLGIPALSPIMVATDFDVTASTKATVRSYFAAFAEAAKPYSVGVYGDYDTIETVKDLSVLNWQANAAAWSGFYSVVNNVRRFIRRTHPLAHVIQETQVSSPTIGGAIDPNRVLRPFTVWDGVYPPAPPVVPPAPAPAPSYSPPTSWGLYPLNRAKPALRLGAGDRGHVRYAQDVIFFKAGGNITRDGIYGPETDARLMDLKRLFKITEVGIGPRTWEALDYLATH